MLFHQRESFRGKTVAQRLDDQRHKAEATVAKARAEVLTAHEQMTNELSAAEALSRTRVKARLQRRKEGKNAVVSIDVERDMRHHAVAAELRRRVPLDA